MLEHPKYAALGNEGAPGFNWEAFEDGWNGTGLKVNKKVKTRPHSKDKVYSHERYAQDLYNRMKKMRVENVKDIKRGASLSISNLEVVDDKTLVATVGNGASNITIDLTKENNFLRILTPEHDMTREQFTDALQHSPEFKKQLLANHLTARVGTDVEKGSIWDGYIEQFTNELKEQITKNNKAYWAEVIDTNVGGFVVEVASTIRAFMPGSMAASNRIDDYSSLIGRTIEVMVESWSPKYGFVVSRKKYINKMRPYKIQPLREELDKNPDKLYHGRVTGANQYGVFVELDEFITGMLHKSLVSDEMREAMRNGTIEAGVEVDVYIDNIDNNRVVLSDVPLKDRKAVQARREAEDASEKSEWNNVNQAPTGSKKTVHQQQKYDAAAK